MKLYLLSDVSWINNTFCCDELIVILPWKKYFWSQYNRRQSGVLMLWNFKIVIIKKMDCKQVLISSFWAVVCVVKYIFLGIFWTLKMLLKLLVWLLIVLLKFGRIVLSWIYFLRWVYLLSMILYTSYVLYFFYIQFSQGCLLECSGSDWQLDLTFGFFYPLQQLSPITVYVNNQVLFRIMCITGSLQNHWCFTYEKEPRTCLQLHFLCISHVSVTFVILSRCRKDYHN